MEDHVAKRREELRAGKRSWDVAEVPRRDHHIFYIEHVLPLRQLESQSVIDKLAEYRNGQFIEKVELLGSITV